MRAGEARPFEDLFGDPLRAALRALASSMMARRVAESNRHRSMKWRGAAVMTSGRGRLARRQAGLFELFDRLPGLVQGEHQRRQKPQPPSKISTG